jgi:hypothetical protein
MSGSRPRWFAETREDIPRFAFRATRKGIVRWAWNTWGDDPREVRIVSPEGVESRLTSGGFWITQDPDLLVETMR